MPGQHSVRSATNEQMQWLVPQNFIATSYNGRLPKDFPTGPAWITFIVNGIKRLANYVVVNGINEKAKVYRFFWPMFLPAITGRPLP